jgi:exodeoxyribonuclease VII large subunit
MNELVLSVSDFVAVFNQTLEYAYPEVTIVGELANFRVSKNRWVYFDLKDEHASVKFFGTVYQLPGPLEDGLMMQVTGQPRLHPLYGFSINIQSMQPVGEGSLRRAAALLEAKLAAEGLFDESRKRTLPYPPKRIGLITSSESAAYRDFVKILNARWSGLEVWLADVQVQGDIAPSQIIGAPDHFNSHVEPVDVIIITRGGGSAEDLGAFSTEQVTRAVASSRIPTLVAIGHEIDISLAELAADKRASTPSNAAELLVPDQKHIKEQLISQKNALGLALSQSVVDAKRHIETAALELHSLWDQLWRDLRRAFHLQIQLLEALSPEAALKRGYAIIKLGNKTLRSIKQTKRGDNLRITLADGEIGAEVQ